jgi:hypothetical protein
MKHKANPAPKPRSTLNPLRLLLMPFMAVKRLLSSQVRLRRKDGKLQVELQGHGGATIPPPSHEAAAAAPDAAGEHAHDTAQWDQIAAELSELLARHQRTRHFMRYLAYTERALKLGGPAALAQIPLEVLCKTREQLEELVSDWSSPGLAHLRMQLEVLIAEKEETPELSTFGKKPQVEEATESQFLAAERGWRAGDKQPT